MGVTLYSLVTGKVPWDGAGSIIGVQAAVRTEPIKFPEKPTLTNDLCELISKMVAKNPVDRISLQEIKVHSWLTNRGTDPLPSEVDNCRLPVTVTDEEVERVVTRIPKLDTLILIKTMLKQHSFQVLNIYVNFDYFYAIILYYINYESMRRICVKHQNITRTCLEVH